jgi:glycosyltransferase involved in cell wall biosynthesis
MRFLFINQFFPPDPAPTGQLLADVARALIQSGHSVEVVCGRASYEACVGAGDHALELADVRRVGGAAFGRSVLSRLVSYARFYSAAMRHAVSGPRHDVILTLTTPPLLSLTGTLAKHLRGSRHVIWEMDMYPDVAVALGTFAPGGFLDRTVGALADLSRHQADQVIVLGPCMGQRLAARGISPSRITVAQNWVDGRFISPRPFPDPSPLVLLYSGNLGRAHDTVTIGEAMSVLTDPGHFQFIFSGGGAGRAELEAACRSRHAANVRFLPYQENHALADHLGACHIGLVTQIASTCGTVVPSKTYGLMAAGRPFIFIGPREATPARLIDAHRCGWQIEPGDGSGLVTLLELLAGNSQLVHDAGDRGRKAFLQTYDLPVGQARILQILTATDESAALPDSRATYHSPDGLPCDPRVLGPPDTLS